MIGFYFSKKDGVIIPERRFRGCHAVPDWGMIWPNGKMICAEFSTEDNVEQRLKIKLRIYEEHLDEIEEKFQAKAAVVFILDVEREEVFDAVKKYKPEGPFFFCDFKTWLRTTQGQVMTAPIYFWTDGKEYPLMR
jgi:hypothetical protein